MVELDINPIINVGVVKGADISYWPSNPIELRPKTERNFKEFSFKKSYFWG
jgi:hypothetical protein